MFSVKKLSGAIGAELAGVDLTNNLSTLNSLTIQEPQIDVLTNNINPI